METIREEDYVDECKCNKEDCEKCDPDWQPGIDTCDEESESDYDSDDSLDDVYEECGLTRAEKKILQDELDYLIRQAEDCCPNCVEKKSIQQATFQEPE